MGLIKGCHENKGILGRKITTARGKEIRNSLVCLRNYKHFWPDVRIEAGQVRKKVGFRDILYINLKKKEIKES